jgi:hypothetical protein
MLEYDRPHLLHASDKEDLIKTEGDESDPEKNPLRYETLLQLMEKVEKWARKPSSEYGLLPSNLQILNRSHLINLINYYSFVGKEIRLVFIHPRFNKLVFVPAKLCVGQSDYFICPLPDSVHPFELQETQRFFYIMIDEGRSVVVARSETVRFEENQIEAPFPGQGFKITSRKTRRYSSKSIPAEFLQDGFSCQGSLDEFSTATLRVLIRQKELQGWHWINSDKPFNILLKREGGEVIYSCGVRMLREWDQNGDRLLVLRPIEYGFQRVKKRYSRSERFKLSPPPNIIFFHPLIQKLIKLPVQDISITGFAVEEGTEGHATLIPGLIISDIKIEFPDQSYFICRGQIVYRKQVRDDWFQYGFFILNISQEDHLKLSNLLNRTLNQHVEISGQIDYESLWRLFFQSGFIYRQKYHLIIKNRKTPQDIYKKIYINHPDISRHFTYHDRGELQGHIAMLRLFEKTWLIHHYVISSEYRYKKAGLTLLYQLNRYIYESSQMVNTKIEYVICFFRPENRFSNLVFGGAARAIQNPAIISQDTLAYISYPNYLKYEPLAVPWDIESATLEDIEELTNYYQGCSGGLLLEAMDLLPARVFQNKLDKKYQEAGLKREKKILAVRRNKRLVAVLSIVVTDNGLNLSGLNSSVLMIILEPKRFPFDLYTRVLAWLGDNFPMDYMPILIYPADYAKEQIRGYNRIYNLWAHNIAYIDYYEKYLNDFFSKIKLF